MTTGSPSNRSSTSEGDRPAAPAATNPAATSPTPADPVADQPLASARDVYPEFVKELLEAEDKRRASIESRGVAVVTVSGTLVTLLLGIAALVTRAQAYQLRGSARAILLWAVVAFAVAALSAIATAVPQPQRITDPAALLPDIRARWNTSVDAALKKVTTTRLEQLAETQRSNNVKATALLTAVIAQVVAVALLAGAVVEILLSGTG